VEKDKAEEKIKENGYCIPPPLSFPRFSLSFFIPSRFSLFLFLFFTILVFARSLTLLAYLVDRNKNFIRLPFELMSVGLHAEKHARK
jgi:hypothetical protein